MKKAYFTITLILCGMVYGCKSEASDAAYNQAEINKVIASIERYRKVTGKYPVQLKDMGAEYIDKIPKLRSATLVYELDATGNSYYIAFRGRGDDDYTGGYKSSEKQWSIDSK